MARVDPKTRRRDKVIAGWIEAQDAARDEIAAMLDHVVRLNAMAERAAALATEDDRIDAQVDAIAEAIEAVELLGNLHRIHKEAKGIVLGLDRAF